MKIEANKVASFDYVLKNDAGEVLDSSDDGQPMIYLHGAENIIPGLEVELEGKSVGDTFKVTVLPEDGYGVYDESLVEDVQREMFDGVESIEVGMSFQVETPEGIQEVTVSAIDGDTITVNANHPLAGETLHFDVEVTDVRDATDEELEHGHVHLEGHCH